MIRVCLYRHYRSGYSYSRCCRSHVVTGRSAVATATSTSTVVTRSLWVSSILMMTSRLWIRSLRGPQLPALAFHGAPPHDHRRHRCRASNRTPHHPTQRRAGGIPRATLALLAALGAEKCSGAIVLPSHDQVAYLGEMVVGVAGRRATRRLLVWLRHNWVWGVVAYNETSRQEAF